MTEKLARNLMQLHETAFQTNQPSAIFGSIGNLPGSIQRQKPYRIGMWPCITDKDIETVMGFWAAFNYFLEDAYADVRVYYLASRIEDGDENTWSIEKAQFDVDEWTLDDLDENIAIWGKLHHINSNLNLTIFVENDLEETEEPIELVFTATGYKDLVQQIPQITASVGDVLGIEESQEPPSFSDSVSNESNLDDLLQAVFAWERDVFAFLSGSDWEDEDILLRHKKLMSVAAENADLFSAWCLAQATARTMPPGLSVIGDLFVNEMPQIVVACHENPLAISILANGLYKLGNSDQAFSLLESQIEKSISSEVAAKLANLYINQGRLLNAVDVLQEAIQANIETSIIYRIYGYALRLAKQNDLIINHYTLVSPDIVSDKLEWEIVAAYNKILSLQPSNLPALHQLLLQLMELDEQQFWQQFDVLLEHDITGVRVRSILENVDYDFPVDRAVEKLRALSEEQPDRLDVKLNLAVAYLADEQEDAAQRILAEAEEMAKEQSTISEIEYLVLIAKLPEFEHKFGELTSLLEAGRTAKTEDVDFLEEVVSGAPTFADGYVLLAKAYISWDDSEAALEVLLDGQKQVPDHPALLELLAHNLWDAGEKTLAFQYLNRGLDANPNYVPLLVRTALYLCENGQLADAKPYLARAELIAPRSPAFIAARNFISMNYTDTQDKLK